VLSTPKISGHHNTGILGHHPAPASHADESQYPVTAFRAGFWIALRLSGMMEQGAFA